MTDYQPIGFDTDEQYDRVAYKALKKMGMDEPEPAITKQLSKAILESVQEVNDEDKASHDAAQTPFAIEPNDIPFVNVLTSVERWCVVGKMPVGKRAYMSKLLEAYRAEHPELNVVTFDTKGNE